MSRFMPRGKVGLMAPRKRLALVACILGSTVVGIDGSAVGVALPAIRDELGGGLAGQQWASNAYLLTLGALLLLGGSLGDTFGQRRIFTLGLTGFGVASLLSALAPTIDVLVAGRALQGVFGALLVPAALAVIVSVFETGERSRAIGSWAAWSGIGAALGPLVGGELVDVTSWRWVFLLNLPVLALTIGLLRAAIPATPTGPRTSSDLTGALLCVAGLAGLTFGLIQEPLDGWTAPMVFAPLTGGLAVLAAFVVYERQAASPLLPVALFTRRNFALGNIQTLALYASLVQLFFYLVIYLQQVAGWTALKAGLALLPLTVVMLILARRFGDLADRYGPRALTVGGPVIVGAGLLLLLRVDRHVSYLGGVLPAVTVIALGLAIVVAPQTAVVLTDADERNAGAASGINNAIGRIAALVGVAGVGIVITAGFASSLDERIDTRAQTPAAQAVLSEAKANPMSAPDVGRLAEGERGAINDAISAASTHGFRVGVLVTAGTAMFAGLLGAGMRNPRRAVPARECADGRLIAAPPGDIARRSGECSAAPAWPTGHVTEDVIEKCDTTAFTPAISGG